MSQPTGPLLTIIPRYLLRELGRIFLLAMGTFLLLYLLVDFFDRLKMFLKHDATWFAILHYLMLKIPLIITQMTPAATFAAVLLGLGLLGRYNEITAMRASGISSWQIGRPLLAVATLMGVATLAWNEVVVPYCSSRSHYVETVQIKKRRFKGVLSDHGLWYHGKEGIYNIDYFDSKTATLYGLVLYDFGPDFELKRLVEIRSARWNGSRWEIDGATERIFASAREVITREIPPTQFNLGDKPSDFTLARKRPDDLNYRQLARHISLLRNKGIDTTEEAVDLHLKLAVPVMPLILTLVAVPLATNKLRTRSMATSVGTGLAVGFGYYVILALSRSLGQAGAIPALAAAWSANAIFMLIGVFLYLGVE